MNENKPSDAPAPSALPRKKGIRWQLIFFIFATPVFVITSAVSLFRIAYTIHEQTGRKAMAAEIEKLSSEGYTVDNDSTDLLYRSRTSEEHIEAWLELFDTLESPEVTQSFAGVPILDRTIDEEQPYATSHSGDWKYAEVCSHLIANHQELITEIHRLAADPTPAQYPIFFESIETLLSEVQSLRQVAVLLFVDANVAIHTKDRDRVVRDIDALYSLTNHADAVPCMVSRLVGISLRRLALETLKQCIEVDLLEDEQLRRIDEQLKSYCEIGNRWREMTSEELGLDLPIFANPAAAMKSTKDLPPRGHDAVYFITLMRRAMDFQTEDWTALYRAAGELEAELRRDRGFSIKGMDHMLTHLLLPGLLSLSAACINDAQSHRLGRLAIALRLHQHQTQSLPPNLTPLGDLTTKLHPAGSKPFGYQRTDTGAVLWGFELNERTSETPDAPPGTDVSIPYASENVRWVWQVRSKK